MISTDWIAGKWAQIQNNILCLSCRVTINMIKYDLILICDNYNDEHETRQDKNSLKSTQLPGV